MNAIHSFKDVENAKEEARCAAVLLHAQISAYDIEQAERLLREEFLAVFDRQKAEERKRYENALNGLLPYVATLADNLSQAGRPLPGGRCHPVKKQKDPLQIQFQEFKDRLALLLDLARNTPELNRLAIEISSRMGRAYGAAKMAEEVRLGTEGIEEAIRMGWKYD